VQLNIGYQTSAGDETTLYGTYIIVGKNTRVADGQRVLELRLEQEARWRLRTFSAPLYTEIPSKSGMSSVKLAQDGAASHMYPAPYSARVSDQLSLDWWDHEPYEYEDAGGQSLESNGGPGPTTLTSSHRVCSRSADVLAGANLATYPIVDSGEQLDVSVYGWARTNATSQNVDTLECILFMEDETGDEIILEHSSVQSTYQRWPQTYYDDTAGSWPVIFRFTDVIKGWRLKRVGIIMDATVTTIVNMSRVDITGLIVVYSNDSAGSPWEGQENQSLKVPAVGAPYVMFATKPYTAHNFQVGGYFVMNQGADPTTNGQVAWGLVGHAQDGLNYVVGRVNATQNRWEIVQVIDGQETVLTNATFAATLTPPFAGHFIFFEHKDGYYRIYLWDGTTKLLDPMLTHYYDGSSSPIVPSKDSIMHVGIYGEIRPPSFRCPSFDLDDGDGIMMMAGETVSDLDDFDAGPGSVVIDGIRYGYTSKTGTDYIWGPYQARNTAFYSSYSRVNYSGTFDFDGTAVEISHFNHLGRWETSYYWAEEYLIGSENGHTWEIDGNANYAPDDAPIDWRPEHASSNPLNRARYFGPNINGNHVGSGTRMYVGPGLLGISLEDNDSVIHLRGARVNQHTTHEIYCKGFSAVSGLHDNTVQDLIKRIARLAGAKTQFSGDYTDSSLVLSGGTPSQLA
jgi:hypothetical protein